MMDISRGRVDYTPVVTPAKFTLAWDEAVILAFGVVMGAIVANATLLVYPTKIRWIKEYRSLLIAANIKVEVFNEEKGYEVAEEPGLKICKDLIDQAYGIVKTAHTPIKSELRSFD